jgi:hypothetical protein
MSKPLQKIARSQLRSIMIMLYQRQGCKCAICGKPIDFSVTGYKANYAVDHDHETGEIRGTLHKSCNSAEGKVANAAGRWGAKSTKQYDIEEFIRNLVKYWDKAASTGTGMMYPDHKTPEQLKEAANAKRRKEYAKKKAAEQMKRNANK